MGTGEGQTKYSWSFTKLIGNLPQRRKVSLVLVFCHREVIPIPLETSAQRLFTVLVFTVCDGRKNNNTKLDRPYNFSFSSAVEKKRYSFGSAAWF